MPGGRSWAGVEVTGLDRSAVEHGVSESVVDRR